LLIDAMKSLIGCHRLIEQRQHFTPTRYNTFAI
jgi:hypothetical protein